MEASSGLIMRIPCSRRMSRAGAQGVVSRRTCAWGWPEARAQPCQEYVLGVARSLCRKPKPPYHLFKMTEYMV